MSELDLNGDFQKLAKKLTSACCLQSGKKVVDVAVGSTHCLALTDDGEVLSWGSNDKLQHFDTLFSNKKQPKALPGLNSKHIVGISCGPGQVSCRHCGSYSRDCKGRDTTQFTFA